MYNKNHECAQDFCDFKQIIITYYEQQYILYSDEISV